jgi:AraC-like DNA-binding protein
MHSIPTMAVCLQGIVRIRRIHGQTLDLHAGEILLIAPGVWHEHAPILRDSIWFGQGFMAAWSDVVLGGQGVDWIGKIPTEPSLTLLHRALLVPEEAAAKALIHEVLGIILSKSIESVDLGRPELRAMIDRLWACCHSGIKVDDLVNASGLSRAQAYNVFKRGYGVTPKQAIESMRLWLASSYMESGLTSSEAALQAGYTSADSFRRAWKRVHQKSRFVSKHPFGY